MGKGAGASPYPNPRTRYNVGPLTAPLSTPLTPVSAPPPQIHDSITRCSLTEGRETRTRVVVALLGGARTPPTVVERTFGTVCFTLVRAQRRLRRHWCGSPFAPTLGGHSAYREENPWASACSQPTQPVHEHDLTFARAVRRPPPSIGGASATRTCFRALLRSSSGEHPPSSARRVFVLVHAKMPSRVSCLHSR
jgi:hypothetical protein